MKRLPSAILLAAVAALLAYFLYKTSMSLAAMRIYHVDECQNVFMARILATGQGENYFASASLFLVPLIWLAGGAHQAADLFASARLISLLIFWINLFLVALATGEKLLSPRGLVALVGAATLAPFWDFGFEVRPENLLLTGLLLTWCAVRLGNAGMPSYLVAGALAVAMQFTAHTACFYTLPLTLAILACPPLGGRIPRWKLALTWAIGALGMFLAVRLLFGAMGLWNAYLAGSPLASWTAFGGEPFERWEIAGRLAGQTPLLLALLAAAWAAVVVDLRHRGRTAFSWENPMPEALLFLSALVVLVLNPKPHNLLILVPFAYLFTYRYVLAVWKELWAFPFARPLIFTLLLFAHFIPFLVATRRHLDWPNHRQESLTRWAEELTNPATDPVFDGIGMVPTRRSIDFHWLIRDATKETTPPWRDKLAARPAAVIIRSYRTSWLPEEDHEFIRGRYVSLADDFWVLGKTLPAGGGEFEIHHPGRYHVAPREVSNLDGTYERGLQGLLRGANKAVVEPEFVATLDGIKLTNRTTVELTVGTHRLETTADCKPTVVWAGPRLKQAPRIGEGSHRDLFVNCTDASAMRLTEK